MDKHRSPGRWRVQLIPLELRQATDSASTQLQVANQLGSAVCSSVLYGQKDAYPQEETFSAACWASKQRSSRYTPATRFFAMIMLLFARLNHSEGLSGGYRLGIALIDDFPLL